MANFSDEKINTIWKKAQIVEGINPNIFRKDFAGAWIQFDKYATQEVFGWEIDHMFPESLGGTDNTVNLQPLQWENNRTKANNFPEFTTSITSNGNVNTYKDKNYIFPIEFIKILKQLYPYNKNL